MSIESDLIGPTEAGVIWGVSGKTVRAWAKEGKLPCVRTPGGRYKYSKSKMLEMRDSYEQTGVHGANASLAEVAADALEKSPIAERITNPGVTRSE